MLIITDQKTSGVLINGRKTTDWRAKKLSVSSSLTVDTSPIKTLPPSPQKACQSPVAQGEQEQAHMIIIPRAVIGDVPATACIDHVACAVFLALKFLRGPIGEGRQSEAMRAFQLIGLRHNLVDARAFLSPNPFIFRCYIIAPFDLYPILTVRRRDLSKVQGNKI
ncbi:hypothetical protein ROLI_039200 [Roseobacter fucihabitans]|uniref:Uncharacterized protein n=1 Tax=Roseobacter fucihabitans TaxID=1537242 RepID=A0ABZ2BZG1_9RHOB|nr:hypothetical protein [Roseobacter litoralis]